MGGEHVRHAADLAATHRVRLAGDREGPHAGTPDPPGDEVAIDDRVDLVGAGGGLVHALGEDGDHLLGAGPEVEEGGEVPGREAGRGGIARAGGGERGVEAGDMGEIRRVRAAAPVDLGEQRVEQRDVGVGGDAEMEVGEVGGGGPARVDRHDLHRRARGLGGGEALVEHRMAPGEVGTDQHDEIRFLKILVGAGHGVGAEGASVSRDGGGHAEARIGVDVGGADEALHELVGDVIVLGEQLARAVDRDALRRGGGDARRDEIERGVPAGGNAMDARCQQASVEGDGLAERRALEQRRPRFAGCSGSPAMATPPAPSGVASTPQPTPQ